MSSYSCDNTPPADPHYLNQPNYSWPSESSSGFSHLWPWVFHIPLPTHKIHNREGGRKRRTDNPGLGLALSERREKSVTLLCILCFCGITRACTRTKLPQATSNVDLSSRVGQPGICWSTGLSSRLSDFCWLVSSLPYFHLLTDLLLTVTGTVLPSSSSGLVGDHERKLFEWVSCQNRQRDPLTGTYTQPHNKFPTSCHIREHRIYELLSTHETDTRPTMGHIKVFQSCVFCCWENLRFVSGSFFFFLAPFTSYLPFVCGSFKGVTDGKGKRQVYP